MALFPLQTNVSIYEDFLDPVPKIFLSHAFLYSLSCLGNQNLIFKNKEEKQKKANYTFLSCFSMEGQSPLLSLINVAQQDPRAAAL